MRRRAGFLILVLGLAGCSTISDWFATDTSEPPAPLPALTSPTDGLRALWTSSGGNGTAQQFLRLRPLVLAGSVVVTNATGEVTAYDSSSGERLWRTATASALTGGTGGGDDLIVVGASEGAVIALNLKDGQERWRVTLSSEVLAPPAAAAGIVVVRTVDGRVAGLSASNGQRLWVFSRTVPVLSVRGTSAPLIAQGRVFVGLDNGQLVALNLQDGHMLWEAVVAVPKGRSELERMVDIDADPVLFGDQLYVAAFQGRVVAMDAGTGQLSWAREISSIAGLGVDRDRVYVTDEDSVVWGLDRASGAALWRQEALRQRALTAPTPYGTAVVVGDLEGYLHTLHREDGRILGRFTLRDDPIHAAPLTQGAVLYALDGGGTIAALRD